MKVLLVLILRLNNNGDGVLWFVEWCIMGNINVLGWVLIRLVEWFGFMNL